MSQDDRGRLPVPSRVMGTGVAAAHGAETDPDAVGGEQDRTLSPVLEREHADRLPRQGEMDQKQVGHGSAVGGQGLRTEVEGGDAEDGRLLMHEAVCGREGLLWPARAEDAPEQ